MAAPGGRVMLRQILANHGHCIPPFRVGQVREWLQLLPGDEAVASMDRCTVVLPRPGDGFYAPPASSNEDGASGFPWGELTATGAEQMRRLGREQLFAAAGGREWDPARVFVRAANRPRSVASAQAAVQGALEAYSDSTGGGATTPVAARPVEVLLQGGEDLVPSHAPPAAATPAEGTVEADVDEHLLRSLGERCGERGWNLDQLLEAALCLEAASGLQAGLGLSADELATLRRASWQRWAAPMLPVGLMEASPAPPAAAAALAAAGPLLRELLSACEAALGGSTGADTVLYVTQANALACVLAAFGLRPAAAAAGVQEPLHGPWPSFAESLEVALVEVRGQPCLRFSSSAGPLLLQQQGAAVADRVAEVPLEAARKYFAPAFAGE